MSITSNKKRDSSRDTVPELDRLPWAILGMDQGSKINFVNRSAEKLTGNRKRYIGKPIDTLGGGFPFLPELMRRTLERGGQLQHIEDAPPDCWLVSACAERERDGGVTGVLAALENISFYHSWCKEQRRQEKLELLGRLTAQTAHEIRNPLTTIKGFIQMYQVYPEAIPWEVVLKEIESIETSIEQFLALSNQCSGPEQQLDLNQLVCEVYPTLEKRSLSQEVWMVLSLPPDLGKITGYPERIRSLITHLCTNALDSMPSGGILAIHTLSKRRHVILKVADTGTGISREYIDKVWEPFFTTHPEKAGLGLSICEQVVKTCGGDIKIDSREGVGTTVTVSFPQTK